MDIPSIHEVNELLSGATISYAKLNCSVCSAEFSAVDAHNHSCAPYLKEQIKQLEARVWALEERMNGDGK